MVKKEKSIKSRGLYGPIDNFAKGNEEGEESLIGNPERFLPYYELESRQISINQDG